eukprot:CAMPEP_0176429868 /NCGR_PEP_ID=MMETSP0127-20121128/13942_1 /TAXON_ID=938130 /ORGANISM="Platyophrya macrostoma, Strain WH" /LENGTH=403 /DNA_ID=CAMNT_0017811705 /DNA_START=40 /DNA_END=1251 /DNA_ORIENTATION=-
MDFPTLTAEITTNKRQTRESKNNTSSFIGKMHQILQDSECQHLIDWNSEGTAFEISNILKFSNSVLPKYFKHRNYSSFVRQLNMYGFRKVKTETAESSFSHEMFKKDEVAFNKIKRLKMKKSQSDDEDDEHFLEKYSGSRSRAQVASSQQQGEELKSIHEQLSKLTEKFKLMQDTTNDLRKTVLSQNDTIKTLMTELIQARADGEKKFKSLVSEMTSGTQSEDIYVEQEDFHVNTVDLKPKAQVPAAALQKSNNYQKYPGYYESYNSGFDSNISGNGAWYEPDSQREFVNVQLPSKLGRMNGNPTQLASREAFTPFNQPAAGQNKSYYWTGNSGYESGNPYPYSEKAFLQETPVKFEQAAYENGKVCPSLIQELLYDGQDLFEEDRYYTQKKIQKASLRNGAY